jgi:Protein of unknown function (DUF3071)
MRALRLIGPADDGLHLVIEGPSGERLLLPVDERLRAVVRGDLARLGQIETAGELRPREIQARVRAGESAEQVAESAGVAIDRVLRFAYPVLQERRRVVAEAQATRIRRGGITAPETLAELVDERLVQRGTDASTLAWDSWRLEDGTWTVQLAWRGTRDHRTSWTFNLGTRTLQADDPAAEQLIAAEFHLRTITPVTPLAAAAARQIAPEPQRPGRSIPDAGRDPAAGTPGRPAPATASHPDPDSRPATAGRTAPPAGSHPEPGGGRGPAPAGRTAPAAASHPEPDSGPANAGRTAPATASRGPGPAPAGRTAPAAHGAELPAAGAGRSASGPTTLGSAGPSASGAPGTGSAGHGSAAGTPGVAVAGADTETRAGSWPAAGGSGHGLTVAGTAGRASPAAGAGRRTAESSRAPGDAPAGRDDVSTDGDVPAWVPGGDAPAVPAAAAPPAPSAPPSARASTPKAGAADTTRPGSPGAGSRPAPAGKRPTPADVARAAAQHNGRPASAAKPKGSKVPPVMTAGSVALPLESADAVEDTDDLDDDRARRAHVPSWDDIVLGIRRHH